MSNILVTGVNGFVGKHLVRELHSQGCDISGVGREPEPNEAIKSFLTGYTACDLTKPEEVSRLPLERAAGVISLAGLAQVGASFKNPEAYKTVNVQVLSVLCNELLNRKLAPRVVAISTGAVYDPSQPLPLTETSKLIKDGSPYALSKLAMEKAALKARQQGLECTVVRPFNHAGPKQEPGFLIPDLYAQLTTNPREIRVGNLNTRRDFTDVRDVVRAYSKLVLAPSLSSDVYNVCSGRSLSGPGILELLIKTMGLKDMTIEQDSSLIRPDDPMDLYGSYEKLQADTGWQPTISLKQTIKDFVAAAG